MIGIVLAAALVIEGYNGPLTGVGIGSANVAPPCTQANAEPGTNICLLPSDPTIPELEAKIAKLEARVEALEHPKKTDGGSVLSSTPLAPEYWDRISICATTDGANLPRCEPFPNGTNDRIEHQEFK